ncbi:MAG: Gfo/Idh/MocA family oxidoreductase [Acidobacteria bacterium]|nr:Gfo/Idh/MocA family oxidoreductase [Acidobacteriota bacterium]
MSVDSNRRTFLGSAASFMIVPRHALGGPGYVAPSDKITLAHIGVGTEGLRELPPLLLSPEIQVVAVCDPNKYAGEYRDWSRDGIRNSMRRLLGKPDWTAGPGDPIPGGRDAAQNIVETYYANARGADKYKGCAAYADFRELLEKEKDINAVKVMTPDHLHGVVCMAAMRKGKHAIVHKPIANRLEEAHTTIETARQTGVSTHFMPWDANGSMDQVMAWINGGAIGKLREVHNWTNRPVWPQFPSIPTSAPPVPNGFDWDLWLGPEAMRPYHPDYTHMTFRGWYDFGGGSMADMGHYSLWTVFDALELSGPTIIDPMFSHDCVLRNGVSTTIRNDFSFPTASAVRFRYPAKGARPQIDLIWYDGGIRPPLPEEVEELPLEGMMFVGDKGKILCGFHVNNPWLLSEKKPPEPPRERRDQNELSSGLKQWIAACKGAKQQSPGAFVNAWPISEAVNLYAVALRTRKRLAYDPASRQVTNFAEANKYLTREYRDGWAPKAS